MIIETNHQPMVYLASASPRRRELLEQIGVGYELVRIDVPEQHRPGETPADFVLRLATDKANAGWHAFRRAGLQPFPVLGADTAVVVGERILGKPVDETDGLAMLRLLAGNEHQVYSAIAVCEGESVRTAMSVSRVSFRPMSAVEIKAYWDTGEGIDKAGCYAIQGIAAQFIQRIEGSYSGIMGLPLFETATLLAQAVDG